VALNGDPNTGYYIYNTLTYSGITRLVPVWRHERRGASVGALIALADQGRSFDGPRLAPATPSIHLSSCPPRLPRHSKGSNGYAAGLGYDLVTGRGTPKANLVVQHLLGLETLSMPPVYSPKRRGFIQASKCKLFLAAPPFASRVPS